MQHLEEKLEIMQWLYDKDLEFDQFILVYDSGAYEIINEPAEDWKPWYPLEQVLELLPQIKHADVYWNPIYIHNKFSYCYFDESFDHGAKTYRLEPASEPIQSVANSDTHLAALKLLKQVIEKYPESVG